MNTGAPRRLAATDRRRALALLGITRWERRVRGPAATVEPDAVIATAPTPAPVFEAPGRRAPAAPTPVRPVPPVAAPATRPAPLPNSPLDGAARPTLGRTRLAVQVNVDAGPAPLDGPYRVLLLQVLRAVDVLPMDAVFNPTDDDELPELVLGGAPRRDDALLGPPLAVLRANPKAKRNLWPMLRRLARRLRR